MDAYFNQFMKDREQFLHLVAILESENCQLIVSSGAFSKMAAITIYIILIRLIPFLRWMDKMAALNNLIAALFDCSMLSDSLGASRRNDLEKNKQQQKKYIHVHYAWHIENINCFFKFSILLASASSCRYQMCVSLTSLIICPALCSAFNISVASLLLTCICSASSRRWSKISLL